MNRKLDPYLDSASEFQFVTSIQREKWAVRRGAALLDEIGPEKWWNLVDIATLNLETSGTDVLSFLYGTFYAGRDALGLSLNSIITYGFEIELAYESPVVQILEAYARLNKFWEEEILRRRKSEMLEETSTSESVSDSTFLYDQSMEYPYFAF